MTEVSVRDLRNRFAKVKRLVESEGEVIVTDNATPRYGVTLYTPPGTTTKPVAKDYIERIKRHQRQRRLARAAGLKLGIPAS